MPGLAPELSFSHEDEGGKGCEDPGYSITGRHGHSVVEKGVNLGREGAG